MADEDQTTALKYVLNYAKQAYGEDAPVTIRLMHRYGYSLYKDGKYREAINVLKETLERSTNLYGEPGGEAFEINMNLGYAYSQRRERWEPRLKYFDRALEILRERGEQESITYVATLVNIVINLLNSSSLRGEYTLDFNKDFQGEEISQLEVSSASEYRNNFRKPEKYLQEAVEIGARLEHLDEYVSAKIAVLQARLNVLETADLAAVPGVELTEDPDTAAHLFWVSAHGLVSLEHGGFLVVGRSIEQLLSAVIVNVFRGITQGDFELLPNISANVFDAM